jgi:transglutaminase-like putative cysteine protease
MSALYRVEHETRYAYASSVSTSQHVAYLCPRDGARQRLHQHDLRVDPPPTRLTHRTDCFGNRVAQFTLLTPHDTLHVAGHSLVEVREREGAFAPMASPPWEAARDALIYTRRSAPPPSAEFVWASPYVSIAPELAAYAHASFETGRPLLDAAIDLMMRIHADFRFDPSATTITTPVTRVLEDRHGVCQDFAHLLVSCMRSLGLSARYVSGYLLTDPPPGQPRLIGADASHAWVSVHCPNHGWVDLDPTNALVPDIRHVTLAWGRDYGDVSPLRGVLLGGEEHTLTVGVSVIPLAAADFERALVAGAEVVQAFTPAIQPSEQT